MGFAPFWERKRERERDKVRLEDPAQGRAALLSGRHAKNDRRFLYAWKKNITTSLRSRENRPLNDPDIETDAAAAKSA